MKNRKFAYIHWDVPYAKRKQIEALQDLKSSLKELDYDFIGERVGLCSTHVRNMLKTLDFSFHDHYTPLLKKALREQLLRDVYFI
jgi:hypothetical protein